MKHTFERLFAKAKESGKLFLYEICPNAELNFPTVNVITTADKIYSALRVFCPQLPFSDFSFSALFNRLFSLVDRDLEFIKCLEVRTTHYSSFKGLNTTTVISKITRLERSKYNLLILSDIAQSISNELTDAIEMLKGGPNAPLFLNNVCVLLGILDAVHDKIYEASEAIVRPLVSMKTCLYDYHPHGNALMSDLASALGDPDIQPECNEDEDEREEEVGERFSTYMVSELRRLPKEECMRIADIVLRGDYKPLPLLSERGVALTDMLLITKESVVKSVFLNIKPKKR